jgi:hypothetical protein
MMKKCYNKKCEYNKNCKTLDYDRYLKKCKKFKKGITKAEILKMAYDIIKNYNWSFFINYDNEWYFDNKDMNGPEGTGFKSLYEKCKELLNEKRNKNGIK